MRLYASDRVVFLCTGDGRVKWPRKGEPDAIERTARLLVVRGGEDVSASFDECGADLAEAAGAEWLALWTHADRSLAWIGEGSTRRATFADMIDATLIANPHGAGLASAATGEVMWFRPGMIEPEMRRSIGAASALHACPTARGLLATINAHPRSRLVHVGPEGVIAATEWLDVARAPARLAGDFVLDPGAGIVVRDRDLQLRARPREGEGFLASAASHDGWFAVADETRIVRGRIDERGRLRGVIELAHAELRRQRKRDREAFAASRSYVPRPASGVPSLGFPAKPVVAPPWVVSEGEFALPIVVRSAGGEGVGLAVHVSGDALASARFDRVRCGQRVATLMPDGEGLAAVLPEARVPEGLLVPLEPAPRTEMQQSIAQEKVRAIHLELLLEGRASAPGKPLLRVMVTPLAKGAASLKWMRPLAIG